MPAFRVQSGSLLLQIPQVILKTAEELTEGSLVEADNGSILEVVKIEPITPMHSYELRTESTTDAPGAVLKCTGRHRIVVPVESDGEFGVEQAVRLSRGQRVYCSGFVERILVDSVVYSVEGPRIPVFPGGFPVFK